MVTNNNLGLRFFDTPTSKLPEGQTLAKHNQGSTIFYWKSLSLTSLLQNCHLLHNIDHEMTSFYLGKVRQDIIIKALQQALPGKAVMLADIVPKGGSGRGYSSSFNVFSLFVKENCGLVAYLCRNSDRHAHVLSIQYPFFPLFVQMSHDRFFSTKIPHPNRSGSWRSGHFMVTHVGSWCSVK